MGYAKLIQNRYNSMRRYFSEFVKLPFLFEHGSQPLKESIRTIRQLDAKETSKIPNDINAQFIDKHLRLAMLDEEGNVKRNLWEMGVAIAIKDGFRSGDLYVNPNYV